MRAMLAGGSAGSREVFKDTVEELGHECLLASDGLEAWEIYQSTPEIDLMMSGWGMPGLDGLELCRKIRRSNGHGYTYFVILASPEDKDDPSLATRAGADDYLPEPLDVQQVRERLLTASRVTSLRRRLNGGSKVQDNTGGGELALRDSTRLRTNEALSRKRLGIGGIKLWDALIAQGMVTEEQVQLALETQKRDPRELRKIMVSLGFISEAELAQIQAQQLNLDYIELNERDVEQAVVGLVPKRVLLKHRALPLRIDNSRRLVVAMSDPTDIHALEDLRITSGYQIFPVVATEDDIRRTQAKVLAIGEEVTKLLEDAAGERNKDYNELDLGIEVSADEKPIIRLVSSILQQALGDGASDIHIEPRAGDLMMRLRVDGVLREVMSIPPKLQSGVISRLKILGNLDIAERRIPQDGRFTVKLSGQKVDLRVATLPTVYGERVVLRLLDTTSVEVNLDKLGFDPRTLERYEEVFRKPSGTTLVTGPTGSGKTTTLYATLRQLNSPEKNIVTVEDPVEFRIRGISQVQVNPRAGLTFAAGLRGIIRSDPDILMIGEIRDQETAKTGVEAALTGHLVLATLHTNNAPAAVNRLTDMGVEPFLTASAVDCVVAQRLARRLCERCKEPAEIEEEILQSMQFPFEHLDGGDLQFYRPVGCSRCGGTGYRGRLGLYELMVVSKDIRDLILRRSSTDEIAHLAEKEGMIRLRDDGLLKAARGITTIEEALRVVL